MKKVDQLNHWMYDILKEAGVSNQIAAWLNVLMLIIAFSIICYTIHKVAHKLLKVTVGRIAENTSTPFDDHLVRYKALFYISQLPGLVIVMRAIPWVFIDFPDYAAFASSLADVYLIILCIWIAKAFLNAGKDYLKTKEAFKDKPVESFVQVIMIALYFTGALLIFSSLTGKSVIAFLTAMGAASAILLLIFKDTLLGFVASIQVSANDMVRIGDWITLDKYGADGDVIEINLTTVKVQNFDKTITTIPTYYLISDSFRNWRGMEKGGGRRIKRSIFIKLSSIRYMTDEELHNIGRIQLLKPYLDKASVEIEQYNESAGIDKSLLINGRNLTNAGLFRKYTEEYLSHHPKIHKELTMMVRQLAPNEKGMPIEIYAFTNDVRWVNYEHIMADIFDHLLAAVKYFDLQIFEFPTSGDFTQNRRQVEALEM